MSKDIGYCGLQKKIGNKYGKKSMNIATKTGIDAAKAASQRVIQKPSKSTGDLIGSKIARKNTSTGKTIRKEKEDETNRRQ